MTCAIILYIFNVLSRILKYVKGSVGETDVPDSLDELIMQRRRWLNGSFFAAAYSLAHVMQILRSGHSVLRKLWLFLESVYTMINLVFAWYVRMLKLATLFTDLFCVGLPLETFAYSS